MSQMTASTHRAYGGPVFEEGPWPVRLPGKINAWAKRGRPRQDEKAAKIAVLQQQGQSWRSICKTLKTVDGVTVSIDACRKLYRSRRKSSNVIRNRLYPVFLQLIKDMQRELRLPKRRGRPRKNRIRFEARQMQRDGSTLGQIAIRLNAKHNQNLPADAYRKLCGPVKHVVPWRKLDLNFIRGLKSS